MTTGQPIRFPSDRNKYNNEYMESLQLQINLNQNNLEVNRLYKETGQLPASTQMTDTRSNEEKLADVHSLKQSIISDLAPIAEPMFASAVIQGVIDSPLNVDNSLFRYLAQNAQTFAQTLSKKYKFGIAGDANDLAIMVQFLEDAYNKTKNSFQSIKGYINSNTNEGNKSRSNILSANDTDNVKLELVNVIKRFEYINHTLVEQVAPVNLIGQLRQTTLFLAEVNSFLPTSNQMNDVIEQLARSERVLFMIGQPAPPPADRDLLLAVLKILKTIPRAGSIATLLDICDKALDKRDYGRLQRTLQGINQLFIQFISPENRQLLRDFRNEFLEKARIMEEEKQRISSDNLVSEMKLQNQQEEYQKHAKRVYVVNPANDPVNIQGIANLGANLNVGYDADGGSQSSYDSNMSINPQPGLSQARIRAGFNLLPGYIGSTVYSQPMSSVYSQPMSSDYSQPMSAVSDSPFYPPPSVDRINEYDAFVNNLRNGDPLLYADGIRQLNNEYADLDGYGVLIDPDFAAVYQPTSASLSSSDVSLAGTPVSVPLNHPNFAPVYPKADDVGKAPSLQIPSSVSLSSSSSTPISDISAGTPGVKQSTSSIKAPEPPVVSSKQPAGRYAPLTSDNMKETRKRYVLMEEAVTNARDSKDAQTVNQLENAFFNELGKTIQAVKEAEKTQRFGLLTEPERNDFNRRLNELQGNFLVFTSNPNNKDGIITQLGSAFTAFKNTPGYHQLMGYRSFGTGLKRVKKGRGLYSPFCDSEINHKNLENNILTIRRKSKTNYMDLPSKHISKHMKNIIHNIIGGKIANFEDIQNLNDEERNYLSKVVKKSNLQDRLSVPAPSKDQSEKDNHQWEVMRGEIMAGNDSHELVKKFKILTLKLTRQGLLPKNEVMDLFEDLVSLGY